MVRFLAVTFLLIACLLSVVYLGARQGWFVAPSYGFEIILFTGFTTAIMYRFLNSRTKSPLFTQAYLASMVFKLVTYGIFILAILYFDRPGAVQNAVLFMASYLLFTILEIGFLFRSVNR